MYRNVSDFTTRWFLRGSCHVTLVPPIYVIAVIVVVVVVVVVVVIGVVLALSNWGPLVKQEMRTVISVTTRTVSGGGGGGATVIVNLMRMIAVVVAVVVLSRRSYVDPLLLPLPDRPSEHSGRSVPSGCPSESGPNSFHHSLTR